MRGGIVLLAIGLFLGWLAISGKYCCLSQLWTCAASDSATPCDCGCSGEKAGALLGNYVSLDQNIRQLLAPLDAPGVSVYPYGPSI